MEHEWKKDPKCLNSSGNYGGQRLKFSKVVCLNRKIEFKGLVVKAVSSAAAFPPPSGKSGKNDWKVFRKESNSKGVSIKVVAEAIGLLLVPIRTFMVMILCLLHCIVCIQHSLYVC